MKLRNKKMVSLAVAGTIALSTLSLGAAQLTKQVQVRYNNIKVQVDQQYKQPNLEPFFIGDSVYVSLRDAGELIGAKVGWDGASQTVKIDTSTVAGGSAQEIAKLKQDLANANLHLAAANSKIAKYEKELGITEGSDKEDDKETDKEEDKKDPVQEDIKETLKFLKDKYGKKHDVDWKITLTGDEDDLEVVLTYDSKKDGDDYADITKSKLEDMLEGVLDDIEYDFKGAKITGVIYDSYKKEDMVDFSMSSSGRFDYEILIGGAYTQEQLDKFSDRLMANYDDLPSLTFGGQYDTNSISIRNIKLKEEKGNIAFEIYTTSPKMANIYWRNMDTNDRAKVETYMEEIQTEIEKEFKTDATGYIMSLEKEMILKYTSKISY